jgi:tetratricopeptide (TPR) repeat protein
VPVPVPAQTVTITLPNPAPTPPKAADLKSAATHNQRGRDLLNSGKYRDAVAELTLAIEDDPKMALAYNARGFAYYLLRDYTSALKDFDTAIELNPGYQNAMANRELARKAASAKK